MVIAVSVVVVVVTFARKTSIDGNNDACVCVYVQIRQAKNQIFTQLSTGGTLFTILSYSCVYPSSTSSTAFLGRHKIFFEYGLHK